MKKYLPLIVIMVLTFGIGVFIARTFEKQASNIPFKVAVQEGSNYLVKSDDRGQTISEQLAVRGIDKKFTCNDKTILAVLSDIKLNKELQDQLGSTLDNDQIDDCSDMFRVEDKDLNRDGINEFFVTTTSGYLCSARSDCPKWVVAQKGGKARIIFSAWRFQDITANEAYFGGYQTIETFGTYGGCCYLNGEFRFEKGRYKAFRCTEWSGTKTGYDKPRYLKPEKCTARR